METSRNFFGVLEANWNYSIHRGWGIFENEIKSLHISIKELLSRT